MATGAIRLAIRHRAELIPCSIIDEGRWRFQIELGRPAPEECLATETELVSAGKHLARLNCFRISEPSRNMCGIRFNRCSCGTLPSTLPDGKSSGSNPSILNNLLRDNPIVVTGMGCFSRGRRLRGCAVGGGHRGRSHGSVAGV